MELSMRELNELIYCIDVARKYGQLLGTEVADKLAVRLRDELDSRLEMDLWDNTLLDGLDEKPFTSEYVPTKEKGWITQAILDYVDNEGVSTYKEINEFYRFITGGSNSFSHHLYNLITPYKNRPTRRYLVKRTDGKYIVKVANESNWVTLEDDVKVYRY
jgi:hypothetical protein